MYRLTRERLSIPETGLRFEPGPDLDLLQKGSNLVDRTLEMPWGTRLLGKATYEQASEPPPPAVFAYRGGLPVRRAGRLLGRGGPTGPPMWYRRCKHLFPPGFLYRWSTLCSWSAVKRRFGLLERRLKWFHTVFRTDCRSSVRWNGSGMSRTLQLGRR